MKRVLIPTILLVALLLSSVSCERNRIRIIPSGNITTEYLEFGTFNELNVSHAFEVEVSFDDSREPIEIIADDNIQPYIRVEKIRDALIIRLDQGVNIRGNATLKAVISAESIQHFTASGASRIKLMNTLSEEEIRIRMSGASFFEGNLVCGNLDAELSGASNLVLTGECGTFDLYVSGASIITGLGMTVDFLNADLSGASYVKLTVNEELDIRASGASIVEYGGSGTVVRADVSGASLVRPAG